MPNNNEYLFVFSDNFRTEIETIRSKAEAEEQMAMAICGLWELHAPVKGSKPISMHADCLADVKRLCYEGRIIIEQSQFWLDAIRLNYVVSILASPPPSSIFDGLGDDDW